MGKLHLHGVCAYCTRLVPGVDWLKNTGGGGVYAALKTAESVPESNHFKVWRKEDACFYTNRGRDKMRLLEANSENIQLTDSVWETSIITKYRVSMQMKSSGWPVNESVTHRWAVLGLKSSDLLWFYYWLLCNIYKITIKVVRSNFDFHVNIIRPIYFRQAPVNRFGSEGINIVLYCTVI